MAQPTAYDQTTDFSDYQTANPAAPFSGALLDTELGNIETTLDETLTNLALIQRDDGELANESVHADALDATVRALFVAGATYTGAWVTATDYDVGDVVSNGGSIYICEVAHTSGTFATDLAAAKWLLVTPAGSPAPNNATYIVQTSNGTLTAEQVLASLATGIVKNTTTTGVLSIAAQGTDYYAPSGTDVAVADGGTGSSTAAGALTNLGALPLAGGTMTGDLVLAGDPNSALKAATKQYVDNVAAGLDPKGSCKASSTANLTLSGEQTIDGISCTAGDRVLVKDQTAPAENGIYVVAAGAWSRATDMDAWTEVPGAMVVVEQGTSNADKGYVCTSNTGGTLNTTAITWVQFIGTGAYQPLDSDLTAIAALSTTSYGRAFLELANQAALMVLLLAASDSASGIVELATAAETTTGTDAGRAVTPDGLAGSEYGVEVIEIEVFAPTIDWTTGDGKKYFTCPTKLNGWNLIRVHARAITAGTTNTSDIQIANVTDAVDVLSTKLTIDSAETGSDTAATPAVINASNDDIATNDLWRVDIDAIATTPPKGLILRLEFQKP